MNSAANKTAFEIQALQANGEWETICPALTPRHAVEMKEIVEGSSKAGTAVRIWSNRLNKVIELA